MLGFVIPLKSQKISSNWNQVSNILERTLRSIYNQSSDEYRVLVVCNEIPELKQIHAKGDSKTEFFQVDYGDLPTTIREKDSDKSRKIWAGINVLILDENISHIMILDADDLVSSSLVEFVCSHKSSNGWFMNSGFEYPEGKKIVYYRSYGIHYRTGSSHIIRKDILKRYADVPFDLVDIEFLYHQNIRSEMISSNTPLEPFPFPGIVYVVEHGENHYLNRKERLLTPNTFMDAVRIYGGVLRRVFIARPLSDKICDEFSLYSISEGPISHKSMSSNMSSKSDVR
jgi:hypothetical protein